MEVVRSVAVIRIDNPPVNAISRAMCAGIAGALAGAIEKPEVSAVLIVTLGKTFMAGMDLADFDGPAKGITLQDVQAKIEGSPKPVVVAIQGLALGGGLELALACHARLAGPDAKLGLPEITLGLVPGAGGTQRLPRLIGAPAALDMILSGAPLPAAQAATMGLVDAVIDGDLQQGAIAYAETLGARGELPTLVRERTPPALLDGEAVAAALKAHARALRGRTTQNLVVEAVEASALPFDLGLSVEARLAQDSLNARESQALRHLFFAEREAAKIPGLPKVPNDSIRRAAVIGAGTMGSGIAIAFADAGLSVTLVDNSNAGLDRGKGIIADNYAASVKRGRLGQEEAERRQRRIATTLDIADAATADVVIEAVFEDLDLKKDVLARVDAVLPADRLLATNTSTLSVSELAQAVANPERVAGLHFFSPAHVMKLLEVVRGEATSPETLARALQVSKILRKIGVVSGDGFGFIGNKIMLDGYFREAEQLLLEGATPTEVDGALERFGFAMGPHRVSDLGGTDVGTKARIQLYKRETRPDPYFVVADTMTEMGRLGQKSGAGFYRYEPGGRDALPDPDVDALVASLAEARGIVRRRLSEEEIVERCLLALINVGAEVLESGVAARASDIDVVWTSGYGFPRHLGGPMFHADTLGLAHVLDRLRHYHRKLGVYWLPSPLIERLAASGQNFEQWDRSRA